MLRIASTVSMSINILSVVIAKVVATLVTL